MEENKELTIEEVNQFIDYSAQLYKEMNNIQSFGLNYGMPYDTGVQHDVLVDLNNSDEIPSKERIRKALASPKDHEDMLQAYSQFMSTWDSIYSKTIDYYCGLLAFNWYPYCINASGSDYNSKEYKDDLKRVYNFSNNFNFNEFKVALKNMLLSDTYYCWLRNSTGTIDEDDDLVITRTNKYSLQMMPQQEGFCKITGKSNVGFLWDLNLDYFSQSTVNIENFDPSLIRVYNEKIKKEQNKSYVADVSQIGGNRRLQNYNFIRTSVKDGAWVFKFNDHTFNTLPPLSHLLESAFNNDAVKALQKNKDVISAVALILGSIKTKKEDSSANNKNPFVINPKDFTTFMKLAKRGIDACVKQIALPTEDNKLFQFQDNNPLMVSHQLTTTAGQGVSATRMIYANTDMSKDELENAMARDYQFVSRVYEQFSNFLTYFVNRKTKKYKFKIKMTGSTIPALKNREIENQFKLSAVGIQVSYDKWASLFDMSPSELHSMMDEFKHANKQDDLVLLLNTNTVDDGLSDTEGRPTSERAEINDLNNSEVKV